MDRIGRSVFNIDNKSYLPTQEEAWPIGMTFKMNAKLNVAIKRKICSPVGCRWRRLRRQLTFERKLLLLLHSDVLECHSSSQQQKVFRHFEESHILRWICQTSARIRILNVKSSWWKFTQKFSTRIKNTLNCRLLSKTRVFCLYSWLWRHLVFGFPTSGTIAIM